MKAVQQGDLAAVKTAVAAGANPNAVGPTGGTALSAAYFWPEITQFLLEKGATPNTGDAAALVMAARYYSIDVMKQLLKAGADPNKPLVSKIDQAASLQQVIDAEKAKGKDANANVIKVYEGMLEKAKGQPLAIVTVTAMQMVTSFTNCRECLSLLLEAGAKADFADPNTGRNYAHSVAFS